MIQELQRMAKLYARLKDPRYVGVLVLHIGELSYTLRLGVDSAEISEGTASDPLAEMFATEENFRLISSGTWTALTAGGRENWRQAAPLDFKLPPGQQLTPELLQMFYDMSMHFFNLDYPNVYHFGSGHTRQVHGGHVSALAYGPGFRFAYYSIVAGEQINNEDDRDSWDQVFTCIGGSGIALIDGVEVALHKGVAIHVPPNKTHTLRASGEVLEVLWLAYGRGA